MPDGLAHPLHLVLPALVQRELERRPEPEDDARRQAPSSPSSSTTPSRSAAARRAPASPRPRPRRPSRRRSADARAGARAAPSFVSRSAPVVSASSRPTGTTRGSCGTRSTTVRRPCGSLRGRDDAGRLVQQDVRERLRRDALAVDLDDVPRADDRVELARLAVDPHAPVADQLVRPPPRRDTGAGEKRVQPHARILARVR